MTGGQDWAATQITTAGSKDDKITHGDKTVSQWCPVCGRKARYFSDFGSLECWYCDEYAEIWGKR